MRKKNQADEVENSLIDLLNKVTTAETDTDREAAKRSFEQAMVALWRSVRIVSNTEITDQQVLQKGVDDNNDEHAVSIL